MILSLVANDDDEDNDLDEDDLELLAENTGVAPHRKAKVLLLLLTSESSLSEGPYLTAQW